MAERTEFYNRLGQVEFTRIRFFLEAVEDFRWTLEQALELRTDLLRTSRRLGEDADDPDRFASMFDPPVSVDPEARRRYQKPAPGFVLHLPPVWPLQRPAGDRFALDVVFWGNANLILSDFFAVLESAGRSGVGRSRGRFKVSECTAADASGRFSPLGAMDDPSSWAPPLIPVLWWLEMESRLSRKVVLTFSTPLRLLSGGRPLFRCDFSRFFPFLLRRITSMCHAYCRIDLFDDPGPVLDAARGCRTLKSDLRWTDVRVLPGTKQNQGIGGLRGRLEVDLQDQAPLLDLLRIGTLLNVGKSAPFGSGSYEIGTG